jgi:transcriptional regulator with XRE-family HTH domain
MSHAEQIESGWRPIDSFAIRLLLVRRALGLTQEEAAEKCGLDNGSWSNWENGKNPRNMAEAVHKIVRALGVDRDWLIWGGDLGPSSTNWLACEGITAGQTPLYLIGPARLPGI